MSKVDEIKTAIERLGDTERAALRHWLSRHGVLSDAALDETLRELVERLKTLDPCEIYLFGSHADGQARVGSDIDVLVIVPESAQSAYQRDAAAYRALGDFPHPVDVMVYTRDEFARRSARRGSLESQIASAGRLIYER